MFAVVLPNVGFSIVSLVTQAITRHGSLIAICLGGYLAFFIIKRYIAFQDDSFIDSSNPYGEWEDYLTSREQEILNNGCSFAVESRIRARAERRMDRAIERYEARHGG